eukprot:NODE_7680_length_750_cov_59.901116_g7430_i0.p1 GENE.NODE_7680_length_750_cov_59.901116_g7430_i0~~NODE_7680_length_750_cov_59.901116_g7430_i0.p1  ORF type:complete len:215 (-),score=60.26 NODE_7680_length_750_cov_59.901116_g7430_i0:104-694(-)
MLKTALFVAFLALVGAITVTPNDGSNQWLGGAGRVYAKMNVGADQKLEFTWSVGTHTVHEFSDMAAYTACNFTGATELKASATGNATNPVSYNWTATTGTHYMGCMSAGHCTSGQKIEISVTDGTTCVNACTTTFNSCKPGGTSIAEIAACTVCSIAAEKCAAFCGQSGSYTCSASRLMSPVAMVLLVLAGFVVNM